MRDPEAAVLGVRGTSLQQLKVPRAGTDLDDLKIDPRSRITALYLLTRHHSNETDVVVALAQRDVAAFSLLQGTDISLAVRPATQSSAWQSMPSGPLLLLKPVVAGQVVQPDDVLALSGIASRLLTTSPVPTRGRATSGGSD
jgi:hypothetical protein